MADAVAAGTQNQLFAPVTKQVSLQAGVGLRTVVEGSAAEAHDAFSSLIGANLINGAVEGLGNQRTGPVDEAVEPAPTLLFSPVFRLMEMLPVAIMVSGFHGSTLPAAPRPCRRSAKT